MQALLILDQSGSNARVVVRLRKKQMQSKVFSLLEDNRGREAFDLLKEQAEVEAYLPAGTKLSMVPRVTLVEALL